MFSSKSEISERQSMLIISENSQEKLKLDKRCVWGGVTWQLSNQSNPVDQANALLCVEKVTYPPFMILPLYLRRYDGLYLLGAVNPE